MPRIVPGTEQDPDTSVKTGVKSQFQTLPLTGYDWSELHFCLSFIATNARDNSYYLLFLTVLWCSAEENFNEFKIH